tara:strand:+ start:638 stop:1141 length:504 start_codon:yes stop_codon:yes gene_type:complete
MILNIDANLKNKVWYYLKDNNIGNRSEANGSKEEQFVGLLGEVRVKEFFNIDHKFENGFDGGFDFIYKGKKFDVKTMGRNVDPKPYYVNNFITYQLDYDCDGYIFCSLNKKTNKLSVCGWVTKNELKERADLFIKGQTRKRSDGSVFKLKAPILEIKNSLLNNIKSL